MGKNNFVSKEFPEMNPFWNYLGKVLDTLPDNPKPECIGFYFTYYNRRRLISEKIGYIPREKELEYIHFACNEVTQTLLFDATSNMKFKLEEESGVFTISTRSGTFCTGTFGHDPMINQAISALWLIAKRIITDKYPDISDPNVFSQIENNFFQELRDEAFVTLDNKWIKKISQLMLEEKYLNFT